MTFFEVRQLTLQCRFHLTHDTVGVGDLGDVGDDDVTAQAVSDPAQLQPLDLHHA